MFLYLIAALGIATLVAGGIAGCEHREKLAARAQTEAVQARFDGFVIEAKRLGEEQEANARAKEDKDRAVFSKTVATLYSDLASRDIALQRLRNAPISRPDRSVVPEVACGPDKPDGTSAQFVPAAEYRALEERSYDDALRLTRLQEWVKATGHLTE